MVGFTIFSVSRFPPGIGMMVAGKLEARGRSTSEIKFTLVEDRNDAALEFNNETETENPLLKDTSPVRLVGGRTPMEGRLQVSIQTSKISYSYECISRH